MTLIHMLCGHKVADSEDKEVTDSNLCAGLCPLCYEAEKTKREKKKVKEWTPTDKTKAKRKRYLYGSGAYSGQTQRQMIGRRHTSS